MTMNNCWKQLRVRYLLSHLLLSVIATGFGFSNPQLGLANELNNQPLNVMTAVSLVKASLHEQQTAAADQQPFIAQLITPISQPIIYPASRATAHYSLLDWFVSANAIRAGPNSLALI